MSNAAAIDAISEGPPADVVRVAVPEGRSRREVDADRAATACAATTSPPPAARRSWTRAATAPRATPAWRASCSRPRTSSRRAAARRGWCPSSSARSSASSRSVDLAFAKRRKLNAYDILTIASMIDREASLARERPIIASVIYNRLREGIPLGIDATIRYATNNWSRPLTQSQLAHRLALQHAHPPRPAAGADRQPRPGGHQGRRAARPHPVPVLRGQARHVRRARLLQDRRRVPARRRALQPRARAPRRQVAHALLMAPAPARRRRLPGGPQPLPGHAHRGAGRAGPGLGVRARCRCRPSCSPRRCARCRGSGFRGLNVTVPHKEAALALADSRSPAAAAIGAANTLSFADDGAIAAENTDAPGFLAALDQDVRGLRATVLGAGGSARAVAWALADAGAARVAVVNRTPGRARGAGRRPGGGACDTAPAAGDLLVNCTSVGLEPRDAGEALAALGLGGLEPPAVVVDLVYGDGPTPVERWAAAGGARFVDGTGGAGAPGGAQPGALDGPPGARRGHARGPALKEPVHGTQPFVRAADTADMAVSRPFVLAVLGALLAVATFASMRSAADRAQADDTGGRAQVVQPAPGTPRAEPKAGRRRRAHDRPSPRPRRRPPPASRACRPRSARRWTARRTVVLFFRQPAADDDATAAAVRSVRGTKGVSVFSAPITKLARYRAVVSRPRRHPGARGGDRGQEPQGPPARGLHRRAARCASRSRTRDERGPAPGPRSGRASAAAALKPEVDGTGLTPPTRRTGPSRFIADVIVALGLRRPRAGRRGRAGVAPGGQAHRPGADRLGRALARAAGARAGRALRARLRGPVGVPARPGRREPDQPAGRQALRRGADRLRRVGRADRGHGRSRPTCWRWTT